MFSPMLLALATGVTTLVSAQVVETRTTDEIYQAALAEGGKITVWHGGDELDQQDSFKANFEAAFPGITMDLKVDLSKYHASNLDQQIAANNVTVDSVILQTLHNFPQWKTEGVLLPYKPAGFDEVYDEFKDADGTYTGVYVYNWGSITDTKYLQDGTSAPKEFTDYLKPEFQGKIVLTYPNDDDAVLFQFYLILKQYGNEWFEKFLAQNPRWVRGTATPLTLIRASEGQWITSFAIGSDVSREASIRASLPAEGKFVSWTQTAAIPKDAPHPEAAKLLHSWILSEGFQKSAGIWSVRRDVAPADGYQPILEQPATNVTAFAAWMSDRASVERFRLFIENAIGTPQGLSPLIDGI